MILGIGCDIVRTSRFTEILTHNPQRLGRLCQRILHAEERRPLEGPGVDITKASQILASSWAAKEALYKSLAFDEQKRCRFNEWRKIADAGSYEMVCDLSRRDKVLVSLSHDGDYTMAMVVRSARPDQLIRQ